MTLPARDLWEDHEFDLSTEHRPVFPRLGPPAVLGDVAVAQKRKLAIGKAILAKGPQSAAEIGRICEALGHAVEYPDRYPRTLVGVKFLVTLYLRPIQWNLTDSGRAWVQSRIDEEGKP